MDIREFAKQNLSNKDIERIEDFVPHPIVRSKNWNLNPSKTERIVWTTAVLELNRKVEIDIDKDIENIVNQLVYTEKGSVAYHCLKLIKSDNPYIQLLMEEKFKWKLSKRSDNNE